MITDEQIRALVAESMRGRQNTQKRTLRKDAEAALAGSKTARKMMEHHLAKSGEVWIALPADLVTEIERYLATGWRDGRDPSRLGALNAVAYIGESVAAIVANRSKKADR